MSNPHAVKVIWNQRLNAEANYSLQVEVVLDEDADPSEAGREAITFLSAFQDGMAAGAEEQT